MLEETIHLEESKSLLDRLIEKPESFKEYHANEIAKILKEIYNQEGLESFLGYTRAIPEEYLGEVLLELPENIKDEALHELSASKLAEVVDELDSDDAADLMQDIEEIDSEKERERFSPVSMKKISKISSASKSTKRMRPVPLCRPSSFRRTSTRRSGRQSSASSASSAMKIWIISIRFLLSINSTC